jgi:hypothetical protein
MTQAPSSRRFEYLSSKTVIGNREVELRSVKILTEPIDTRRMDNVTLLDERLEKGFQVAGGRRLEGFGYGFYLLNANPDETAIWTSGSSFLRPLNIVAPRIARIGAKLEW